MSTPILTAGEVKVYVQDKPEVNYLLPGEEFLPQQIELSITLAIDEFNMAIQPVSSFNVYNFPSKAILMYGVLAKLYAGQAAMYARNQMDYSDGGVSLPIEERAPLYQQIAATFQQQFETMGKAWKVNANIQDGFGGSYSDYSWMPIW